MFPWQVSIYLEHKSIKTTEKHYAPFVKARRINLDEMMERAWAQMGVINSLASQPNARHCNGLHSSFPTLTAQAPMPGRYGE